MKVVAILAVVFCCLLMFRVERSCKAAIMVLGTLIFTLVTVPIPFGAANYLIPLSFLISELGHLKSLIKETKGTIIWKLIGLSVVMFLFTIINSPHLHDFTSIRYFLQSELLFKYFVLLYAFWAFGKDEDSIRPTLKYTYIGMIVLTFFGLLNYLTRTADFVDAMMSGIEHAGVGASDTYGAGSAFTYSDRFRVQAMFLNPFDYGYVCIWVLILHLYAMTKGLEKKREFYIVAFCSIFGIITCGCRTILLCSIIGILVYVLMAFRMKRKIGLALLAILVSIVAYQFIPAVQETTNYMFSMFDEKSKVGGSSMEMRMMQYAAVLYHVKENPFFGCGYGYFNIDLGWGLGKEYLVDRDLYGLEGVVMSYILERGFVGLFLYLLFYICLIIYCFRIRLYSRDVAALGISILATYLCFANMTGELRSTYPTLLLMGFIIKITFNKTVNIGKRGISI